MNILERLSFRQQLLLFFSAGILILLGVTSYIQFITAEKSFREIQVEQGLKLSNVFAKESVLALLYDSDTNAKDAINTILDLPDVVAAEIFRADKSKLIFAGKKEYEIDVDINETPKETLAYEDGKSWYFVAPVIQRSDNDTPFEDNYDQDETLGFIRLAVSKDSLKNNAQEHLINNISTTVALGTVFVLLLMLVTTRLTRPIRHLVNAMKSVESGDREVRAEEYGASDIKQIVNAFNRMVEAREAEEKQIKKAHDMAVEIAQMKIDFSSNVSHELRTPMNGIMGMVDILRSSGGLNQKQSEYLEVIYSSSNSLLDLINDILDFTKIDDGKVEIVNEDFYLEDCIQNVLDLVSGQAYRKDIDIGLIMNHDSPDLVNGDNGRVRQVLINLIGNAIKFTDEGEVVIRLELMSDTEEHINYKFSVEDSGIGIEKESIDRLYEPFQQLDSSSSQKYGGSGLGLTISHKIVEILGGQMGVESTPQKGSTFWFTVPFKHPKNEPKFNIEKHRPEVAGLRVLVVDDSVLNRNAISTILDHWEAYQQTAPTGQSAIIKLKQASNSRKSFDFIIIDQQMKSMSYIDLINQIQGSKHLSATRIIMTINPNSIGRTEALKNGVDAVIQKPVRDIKLYQCITSVMHSQAAPEFNEIVQQELLPAKRKILVVEDTDTNIIVAEEILSRLGCTVDIAVNGKEAVDNYFSNDYDLILMDCRMPIMDGYQATQVYRSRELQGAHTPIIAMTANTQKDDKQNCLDSGMDDYLPKPLTIEKVKNVLIKWTYNIESADKKNTRDLEDATILVDQEYFYSSSINKFIFQNQIKSLGVHSVLRMLDVFVDELPGKLDELLNYGVQHDRKSIIEIAHTLKSSSQNFGADVFSENAKNIEITALSESMEIISSKIMKLCAEGHVLKRDLEQIKSVELIKVESEIEYNVLIAEDDKTEQIALVTSLQNNNLKVHLAQNGSDAISICRNKLPDLILLDALMPEKSAPEMDGFKACQTIKELPGAKNVPILMVTALDDEISINKAIEAGASDFITKPVNHNVLKIRVKQLLANSNSERQLEKVAYTDALTGLPNRPSFLVKTSKAVKQNPSDLYTAILFLGIDNFKIINDGIGHDTGDIILQSVSKRLKTLSKKKDFIARTGGDEFGLILYGYKRLDEIESFAQKVRNEIGQPFYIQGKTITITGSIGISVYPTHGEDVRLLMKKADTAMSVAKSTQNGYLFYDSRMGDKATTRLKVSSGLRNAIYNDELILNYQPKFSVEEQKIIGCEALVRWESPEHSTIFPNEFIPYAEESGLILDLGEWVILSACKQMVKWEKKGFKDLKMAINLSGKQLEQKDLVEKVAGILNLTGALSENIEFEITESSLVKNIESSLSTLNQLRDMGIDISIDDFGTGYNTLVHLERYPVNIIKIDKCFTDNIVPNSSPTIIQAIIALSKEFNFKVVAEGVETQIQRHYLEKLGCDYLQGYLIGKPVSAAIFEQSILRKSKKLENQMELSVTSISKNRKG